MEALVLLRIASYFTLADFMNSRVLKFRLCVLLYCYMMTLGGCVTLVICGASSLHHQRPEHAATNDNGPSLTTPVQHPISPELRCYMKAV